ncbi:MAG TPA: protein kinase [Thermoanaerobaculia bacterium]|nr:protein kinase [Thermoanaerobaculia bacterium]
MPIGTRLGPYQVTALLGSGGMADVYRARDVRLEREVAVKILPADVSDDAESLARFAREARTASKLNHPHLVTIYDIGDIELGRRRVNYIAMELIRGETLRYHLGHATRDVLLRHIANIADGLAKAHDAGVVHRDLKPENILVSEDGLAKVVDFGLAKRAAGFLGQTSSVQDLTAEGFCVGTAGYMAPEQVRAHRDIDGRVDIFALGCMLYEIVAGENPFDGETPFDTMLRVLTHDPAPLADAVMGPIVARCIAKERDERYPSMRELAAELRNALAPPAPVQAKAAIASIAVLPFHNWSGDDEMRFLSDGIPEDVVRSLGRIPTLRVIASSSAARFRDVADPQEAARALNVDAVLVGGVRTISGRVLLDAELVRALDGTALWGKKYTRKAADLVALEEEIARDLCDEVRLELAPQSRRDPRPDAYEAYLRGKREVAKETVPAIRRGVEHLRQAMELDPDYALPHAALGLVFGRKALLGFGSTRDCVMQQVALAQYALQLDESLPEAHHTLALAAQLRGDLEEFERRTARVLALNPNFAPAYAERANMLVFAKRFEAAEIAFQKARELDPLSAHVLTSYGARLGVLGQFDRALTVLRDAAEQFPGYGHVYPYLAMISSYAERHADALEAMERARTETNPNVLIWKGIVLARAGRLAEARAIADEGDEIARTHYLAEYYRAQLRAHLGDRNAALALVAQSLTTRDYRTELLPFDPGFAVLRDDPRFFTMLRDWGILAAAPTLRSASPAA